MHMEVKRVRFQLAPCQGWKKRSQEILKDELSITEVNLGEEQPAERTSSVMGNMIQTTLQQRTSQLQCREEISFGLLGLAKPISDFHSVH